MRCDTCGLIQTAPRLSGEALAAYYPEDYGPHRDAGEEVEEGELGAVRPPGLQDRLKRRFGSRRIWSTPDLPPGARVLELGSGAGHFVRHALARGWDVHAVEPAERPAARLARDPRVHVHREPAEAIRVPPGSLDAVFAWMVVLSPAWVSFGIGAALAAVRQGGRLTVVARAAGPR